MIFTVRLIPMRFLLFTIGGSLAFMVKCVFSVYIPNRTVHDTRRIKGFRLYRHEFVS